MRKDAEFDIGKLIFEGMMTVFIVLIFLTIAQKWVLPGDGEPAQYSVQNNQELDPENF